MTAPAPAPDFAAPPEAAVAVAEAARLAHGHLFNPAFAAEISSIDPLPHQRIAVYERMIGQSPLRFLLADDAGAGKTIMTGLYLREMLARGLLRRVLVVPPAGLVGNWRRELAALFRLPFRIARGADARAGNPFAPPAGDRVIVGMDTLAQEAAFARLRAAPPYDLVVFDEAHKLAAYREGDSRIRKTDRYRLAEALAGLPPDSPRWRLPRGAESLLLLTATPHMGKDFPYYCLWRLLLPEELPAIGAFRAFPEARRRRHFIRRTKEEMVRYDGRPLYPRRRCDTLSHALGPQEQALYDAATDYIAETYDKARALNRSAARLAMSVFQRRLASSTFALARSFERRLARLDDAIALVRGNRVGELERRQGRIARAEDPFAAATADDNDDDGAEAEREETFENAALGGVAEAALPALRAERAEVKALLARATALAEAGEDAKFEALQSVMRDPAFAGEKLIVFTEHRDTAEFLARRLEGLGHAGRVASIHGGLDWRAREEQVELFRRPGADGGADTLVATDAAGEGINLQFCWITVNYDLPWNPARLEQRMGRIHRYGQKRDPVIVVNLVAGETREGRVLKTVLEKLEAIRERLGSEKVFDAVGRLYENVSMAEWLEMAATDAGARRAERQIAERLTAERARELEARDRERYGRGDVAGRLAELNAEREREPYRRLLPGYVRRFVETAAPLLDLRLAGDAGRVFDLAPLRPGAANPLRAAMETYAPPLRRRLAVSREQAAGAIWLHPGEPVFEALRGALLARWGREARRGAVFVDPDAAEPWLFHIAAATVVRRAPANDGGGGRLVERRLVGLRQDSGGNIAPCPVERLLLLRGAENAAPGAVPLARRARGLAAAARAWLETETLARMVEERRAKILRGLPDRLRREARGFDFREADLAAQRQALGDRAAAGDGDAEEALAKIRAEQRALPAERERRAAALRAEADLIVPGAVEFIVHALVLPAPGPEERRRRDAEIEAIAMRVALAYEETAGAETRDVSRPELARRAGLTDWPGFDLLSRRPGETRNIEVKGRAAGGEVLLSTNEYAKAAILRDTYWLYVVFGCAGPRPRLFAIQDPFERLIANARGGVAVSEAAIRAAAAPVPPETRGDS